VQFSIGAGTAVTAGCETGLGQATRPYTTTISSHGRIWGTRCDCSYNGSVPFVSGAGSLRPETRGPRFPITSLLGSALSWRHPEAVPQPLPAAVARPAQLFRACEADEQGSRFRLSVTGGDDPLAAAKAAVVPAVKATPLCALVARAVFTSGRPCRAAAIRFVSRSTLSTLERRSSTAVLPRLGSSRRCWASTPALPPSERIGRGSQGQRDARTIHPRYLDAPLRPAPTTQDANCHAARPHGHVIDEQFGR